MNNTEHIQNLLLRYKIQEKFESKINDWIHLLNCKLNQLEALPAKKLNQNFELLGDIKCPLNDKLTRCEASFLFQAPTKIHPVGSYVFKCNSRNNDNVFEIDLVLEIPKSCWQKKDHLNFLYHWKRAFYLAYIAKHLNKFKDLALAVQFRYFNGNHLKPCIYVVPTGKLSLCCRFNILAFASLGKSFVFKTFHPNKCNIQNEALVQNLNLESTPYYNSSILSDLTMVYINENISKILSNCPNVQDALILVRIWLDKRNLRHDFAHILTVFTCYLFKNHFINPNLSSLQIFETILYQISISDWKSNPIIISFEASQDKELFVSSYFSINLLEANSNLNLCFDLLVGSYERLKVDCEHSLKFLNCETFDLAKIFHTSIDFNFYFDFSVNILVGSLKRSHLKNVSYYIECGFDFIKALVPELHQYCTMAAGDRLSLIQVKNFSTYDSWEITSVSKSNQSNYVTFGMQTKEGKFLDVITKGPIADKPEARQFRELWDKKSEIRRFQNGDIREAVFWKCSSVCEKRKIIINALKYVLNHKINVKLNTITWTFDCLDDLLEMKNIKFNDHEFHYGTGEECLMVINQTINVMKKYLYNLELSFNINDVVNVDPVSRLTDVFPPLSVNSNPNNTKYSCNVFNLDNVEDKIKYVRPIKLVINIEANMKLSNDLEEFKNQKYLFYCELGRKLVKTYDLCVRTHVSYLDIYLNGFVFRLVLSLQKELSICRQLSNKTRAKKIIENVHADQIEFETVVLPSISSTLNALNNENPSFGLTCRLFKRWISCQMIKHFFEEITLDLLVAYSYSYCNHLYPSSNSHLSSFIRLLDFIVNFDFVKNPIILNFNDGLSNERLASIKENFLTQRSNWPIIFIVTPYDHKLSHHTRSSPDTRITFHLKKLAKYSLDVSKASLLSFKPNEIKTIFKANMELFDIIIKLNSKLLFNKYQSIDFPNNIVIKHTLYSSTSEKQHAMPITDYNPVYIYMDSLKKSLGNLALFFYDEFGGLEIGVLLRPESLEQKPFKYSSVEASILCGTAHSLNTDNVRLNIGAFIEDLKIIGHNLVESVVIKSDKLIH